MEKSKVGRWADQASEVAETKQMRLIEFMKMLMQSRLSVHALMEKTGMSKRTVYRYMNLLEQCGIPIEYSKSRMFFIASDNCPLCGKKHKTTNNH